MPKKKLLPKNNRQWAPAIWTLILGFFFTISSCTVVPVKKREDIGKKLPNQFTGNKGVTVQWPSWRQSFPCRRLGADIQTLLDHNFELEAARARVEQAGAIFAGAGSELVPSLSVKSAFESIGTSPDDEDDGDSIILEASLFWEPDIWGRLAARKKAASLSFHEKQALADQTALDLQALLVETWVAYHAECGLERIFVEQLKKNEQLLELTRLHLAQGQGTAQDVLEQRGRLAKTKRELSGVISRKQCAANAYAVLMGRFPDNTDPPRGQWPVLEPLPGLVSPGPLLSYRPDLRAAFLALRAADHETAATVADRLPRFTIGMGHTISGGSLAGIGTETISRMAGGFLAPMFDAGRLKAIAAKKQAQAREALASLEQAMRTAVRQVEDAVARENSLFASRDLLKKQIAISHGAVEKAIVRYVNGQTSFLSVLMIMVDLETLQQNEIRLQQDLFCNRIRFLKAIGAKWGRSG